MLLDVLSSMIWIQLQRIVHLNYYLYHYHLRDAILHNPCRTYLEVGCGAGAVSKFIDDTLHYEEYLGVDIDEKRIRYAAAKYGARENTHFRSGDVRQLPIDKDYDCLLLVGFLHHVPNNECLSLVRYVLPRITRKIVILEPIFVYRSVRANLYERYLEKGEHRRSVTQVKELLDQSGVRIDLEYTSRQAIGLFDFWCGISDLR
jgi:SAM-dependent methyltransferase